MKCNTAEWLAGKVSELRDLAQKIEGTVRMHIPSAADALSEIQYACNRCENILRHHAESGSPEQRESLSETTTGRVAQVDEEKSIDLAETVVVHGDGRTYELTDVAASEFGHLKSRFAEMVLSLAETLRQRDQLDCIQFEPGR